MSDAGKWPSTHMTLLNRLRNPEDTQGWDDFWEIYSPLVYSFCRRRDMQHEDALDVRQNAMLALRRSLPNFDPAKGKFRGWFGQLIRREISKYKDKQIRDGRAVGGEFLPDNPAQSESEDWDSQFNGHVVQIALDRIKVEFGPVEWQVMQRVVLAGSKPRAVADDIGRDAAWISRVKYRLLQRLKTEVHFLAGGGMEDRLPDGGLEDSGVE